MLLPDVPELVISGCHDGTSVVQGCIAGADGWLVKPVSASELSRAIGSAAKGAPVLCEKAEKAVMNFLHRAGRFLSSRYLTLREQEIISCLAVELSDKEISERLGMEMNTVHVHLVHLFRKLSVHNRRQAVGKLLGGEW
jgi:two-component system nitrate/nitrite response regulator NarL